MRLLSIFLIPFVTLVCATAQAQAPAFPEISVGQTVEGTLDADTPALSQRGAFRAYRLQTEPGRRYIVDLRSSEFDAYLTLMRPAHGLTDIVQQDDDGGEGTDSRLRFLAEDAGPYLLVAQAFSPGSTGRFSLSVSEAAPPRAAEVRPIRVGATVTGRLADGEAIYVAWEESETYHHLYSFDGQAGDTFEIAMDSDDFDAYLEFGPLSGGDIEVTDIDDDGGDGRNARLRVQLPAAGTYGVRARSYGSLETGQYALRVRPWTPRAPVTRAVRAGQEVVGELTAETAELGDGSRYELWTYAGQSGERLAIRMRSDEFDTFLAVGRMVGGEFDELAANDDAPDDGTNSLVEITLPASGEYVIRASALYAYGLGPYTLHVERQR